MIYTGYYTKLDKYKEEGLIPIGISGKLPTGIDILWWKFLAPSWDIWKNWHDGNISNDKYANRFYDEVLYPMKKEYLVKLDLFIKDMKITNKDYILLCYEKPGEFCHRHLVADWLNCYFGITVKEF